MSFELRASVLLLVGVGLAGCSPQEPDPAQESDSASELSEVTWSGEVRSIVAENCTGCHFSGGATPFAFETHEEVEAASAAMLDAMGGGRMPPWPADPSCRSYANERMLDEADLATFAQWVEDGAPAGEPTEPISIVSEPFEATHVGAALSPYTPELGAGGDDYRCFFLDLEFDAPTWVEGSTVMPGTPAVHHVLVYSLDGEQLAQAQTLDAADEDEGYTCFGGPLSTEESGSAAAFPNQIAAWVPGSVPSRLDEGLGIEIPAGARVVMQIHYSAVGGEPLPDQTELLLDLTDEPPTSVMRTIPLAIPYIDIPAGDDDVSFSTVFTNWSDAPTTIARLTGHLHLLGTSVAADIVHTSGEQTCGLEIPDWDFDWQLNYELHEDEHLVVGPGEGVRLSCSYDNSAANQPIFDGVQQEPEDVSWGEGSLDEMCLMYASVIEPYAGPPADLDEPACAPAADCFAASEGSLSALMACEATSSDCAMCALKAGASCGLGPCLAGLLVDNSCISDCVMATNAFGGSLDACLRGTCADSYEQVLACADPIVEAGSCDAALAACGLGG